MLRYGRGARLKQTDPDLMDFKANAYIGIMSGTSLDGVDAVLAHFPEGGGAQWIAHAWRPFPAALRDELLALQQEGRDELHRAALAGLQLGQAYARSINELLQACGRGAAEVRAAGVHGQTIRHRPEAGYTIQLNAPATVAALTGIEVVADFRSADLAAGGQGAPLVPAFHAAQFSAGAARAVVNIGGIANITGLPPAGSPAPVVGFDCGPGNVLLDAWIGRHGGEEFDRDGAWAAQGREHPGLLVALLQDGFFARLPPKSTGRDLFHLAWLDAVLDRADPQRRLAATDVQATLVALTAVAIAGALREFWPAAEEVVVCGGGAYNPVLLSRLERELGGVRLRSSAELGVEPNQVEALAFAWLAREHIEGRSAALPAVTGARRAAILGARYPAAPAASGRKA